MINFSVVKEDSKWVLKADTDTGIDINPRVEKPLIVARFDTEPTKLEIADLIEQYGKIIKVVLEAKEQPILT